MTVKSLIGSSPMAVFLAGILFVSNALATPLHRNGCETPLESDMQVCWNAIGEAGEIFGPFPEMHLLPISWDRQGDYQVLAEYSRSVYRQLLPSGLAENLLQEWTPVTHLEEAISQSRLRGWPLTLWISPKTLRLSSAASPGVVDWDVYAIQSGKLLRTLRIRVESHPKRGSHALKSGTFIATLLTASGAVAGNPIGSIATVAGAVATAPGHPPKAGRSLERMTELAVQQIPALFQFPMEGIPSHPPTSQSVRKITGWFDGLFSSR